MSDRYLLLGTDDGLSVLDLLPGLHGGSTHPSGGGHLMSLGDAKPRKLWVGESIHQLALLEVAKSDNAQDGMRGVVLALVGVDSGNGEERKHTVRMYSLSSLCSLITFAVNQPVSDYYTLTIDLRSSDTFPSGVCKTPQSRFTSQSAGPCEERSPYIEEYHQRAPLSHH